LDLVYPLKHRVITPQCNTHVNEVPPCGCGGPRGNSSEFLFYKWLWRQKVRGEGNHTDNKCCYPHRKHGLLLQTIKILSSGSLPPENSENSSSTHILQWCRTFHDNHIHIFTFRLSSLLNSLTYSRLCTVLYYQLSQHSLYFCILSYIQYMNTSATLKASENILT
jgi:hypothetical protein